MVTQNFRDICDIHEDYVRIAEFLDGCDPFDFTGWTFEAILLDVFNNPMVAVISVSQASGFITVTIPANTVTYPTSVYTLKVYGVNGTERSLLINSKILYKNC